MIDLAGSESVSKTTDVLDATRNETGVSDFIYCVKYDYYYL